MPETDLDLLIKAALQSGDLAKHMQGRQPQGWHKPDGEGLVTEADLAVNAMLEDKLRTARPDYGWLSEESTDDPDRLSRDSVFIIDPIDGTRNYIAGSYTWAHSLAIATRGTITAAVIHLPQRDLLYSASTTTFAQLNERLIYPSSQHSLIDAAILTNKGSMDPKYWQSKDSPTFKRVHRPSLAYRLASVADGRFDATLTVFPTWEWDIAAGDLILRKSGAKVTDINGSGIKFNNCKPRVTGLVAANPKLHECLIQELSHAHERTGD